MTRRKLLLSFMIIVSAILLIWAIVHKPKLYGDASEYMGMTISFANHLSPQFTSEDNAQLQELWKEYDVHLGFSGATKALNDRVYFWHFWIYSAICAIPYFFAKILHLHPFIQFQLVNVILYLLVFWWIVYKTNVENRGKIWLVLIHLFNPILLYLPWSSPEVFSYCLLFLGLLEFLNKRYFWACLLPAIGSLQNPGLSIIPFVVWWFVLLRARKITKKLIYCTFASAVVLIQYIFFYVLYHTPSLIGKDSASFEEISLNRIASLFYDLNFGLLAYVPVLLIMILLAVWKKDKLAIASVIILFIFGLICSPQANWNSGMMYINRYSVWFIPMLAVGTTSYACSMKKRTFMATSSLFVIITGIITFTCMSLYKGDNHVSFSPLAKFVISVAPSFYNPPEEIFAERALGGEIRFIDKLPISISNDEGIRKTLLMDPITGKLRYENGSPKLSVSDLRFVKRFAANEDIFTQDTEASFLIGWEGLEQHDNQKYRWTPERAEMTVYTKNDNAVVNVNLSRFYSQSNCKIFVNDVKVYEGIIETTSKLATFNIPYKGSNRIVFVSDEKALIPSDVLKGSQDNRKLSMAISDFSIK
ncbi:hypothetical protein N0M98_29505 [Paenibacillus doosanensis]|uniref:hypothetical protein n=1 Tax=Paenibacillus doosanensis TaxID=1229154 RepID=UPI00217FE8C3|nr:hypothetical protein [Paenibacillus doosanensis]MCS7464243.1 hypothetical protein [Paenibacillus doosanensis]